MKIAAFIDGKIGNDVADIFSKNSTRVEFLILNQKADLNYKDIIKTKIMHSYCFEYNSFLEYIKDDQNQHLFDLGLLCWWPFLIKNNLIKKAKLGFLNFHPSLLPYGRGKHPNFWTFIDDTPFGVTLHWLDDTIDGGDIAFQKEIQKIWIDNGETLYKKALEEIVNLFNSHFDEIINGSIPRFAQRKNSLVHYSRELENASKINLDQKYTARELINLMRARTFQGYPGCWFEENDKRFEVMISIKESSNDYSKK